MLAHEEGELLTVRSDLRHRRLCRQTLDHDGIATTSGIPESKAQIPPMGSKAVAIRLRGTDDANLAVRVTSNQHGTGAGHGYGGFGEGYGLAEYDDAWDSIVSH